MSVFDKFTDQNYLLSTNEELKYWYIYLPFFGLFVFLGLLVSYLLKRQDSYKAKKAFQKQFFWTYVTFGILGMISVFARSQDLPIFGSRAITFVILILFLLVNLWLLYYYQIKTKKELIKFQNKKRKEKWLRKR
ncbi:hypothetical protein C4544_04110 [candidate division WS5 bacterium]|uniref:DUF4870 domain-containing protein n=1 Tax=candidate division WS5 bacterium TaxID=2093353 RepID=A0A419DCN4_9BACT|nr:MAG: hypothetical protein C4544_04110 [candidate division WS5 bacterium]